MARKKTADLDESLEGSDELEDAEEREEDDDGDEQVAEEAAEPPRRRRVSELLEGQDALEEDARSDLQLVAAPLHPDVRDTGQHIYQLDISNGEPQGTLLEPESSAVPPAPDPAAEPVVETATGSGAEAGTTDTETVLKQMIAHRDRQLMAAERDGIDAYELAAGIDEFIARLIETVRRSDG